MGCRTTWLLLALFLLVHPGSFAITGPREVSGLEGGLLIVQCRYNPGWETHVKWWCRGAAWSSCKILVETTGSEKEVKKDRVSIRDNWKDRSFTVTMKELSLSDADTYWCGIERVGSDVGAQVEVTIDSASDHGLSLQPRVGELCEVVVSAR
ncbi:CMRF35-like molecule 1 isoform X2 [Hippopotamus amphibius kiboko]|uniref:CMRF35-like molecule 1 isoform X2 n=1 Tax=Hippopotamus amphibius kiboko TaxID=575201 RepID=UPI002597C129|nr:CMRF35-like molecule 1 isoform X2 [Hippopotamus amphibius kiboko]